MKKLLKLLRKHLRRFKGWTNWSIEQQLMAALSQDIVTEIDKEIITELLKKTKQDKDNE